MVKAYSSMFLRHAPAVLFVFCDWHLGRDVRLALQSRRARRLDADNRRLATPAPCSNFITYLCFSSRPVRRCVVDGIPKIFKIQIS